MASKSTKVEKPLVVGQKVYVMYYQNTFLFIEATLRFISPLRAVIAIETSDGEMLQFHHSRDVIAKSPANRKKLFAIRKFSEASYKKLNDMVQALYS